MIGSAFSEGVFPTQVLLLDHKRCLCVGTTATQKYNQLIACPKKTVVQVSKERTGDIVLLFSSHEPFYVIGKPDNS